MRNYENIYFVGFNRYITDFFVHYSQSPFDDDTGRDDLNMTPG